MAADETQNITLNVRVNDLASAQLMTVGEAASRAAKTVEEAGTRASMSAANWGKLGQNLQNVGRTMTEYVTLPIIGIGVAAVKMAADFQSKMQIIQSETGASTKEIEYYKTAVLSLAKEGPAGPEAIADSLYHARSAGFEYANAMEIVKEAQKEVTISGADMEDTTNSLVGAMYSQIKGAENAHDAMALLNAIIGAGNMRFQDLNGAMSTGFLSAAQGMGVGLKDIGGALDVMVDRGQSATSAATRLRMAMTMMTAPSKQAATILADMGLSAKDAGDTTSAFAGVLAQAGVTTTQLAETMRTRGFNAALHELHDALLKATGSAPLAEAALSKAFGGAKSATTIQLLTDNLDAYDQKLIQISGTQAGFDAEVNKSSQTLNNQFKTSLSAVQSALIGAVNSDRLAGLTKVVKQIGDAIVGVIDWFTKLSPGMQEFVIKAALIAAAIGPVVFALGTFIRSVKEVVEVIRLVRTAITVFSLFMEANPIILAITAVILVLAGAAFLIYKNWTPIAKFFGDIWRAVSGFFKSHWELILGVMAPMILLPIELVKHWGSIVHFFDQLWAGISKGAMSVLSPIGKFFTDLWNSIATPVVKAFNAVVSAIAGALPAIGSTLLKVIDIITYPFRLAMALSIAIFVFAFKEIAGVVVAGMHIIWGVIKPVLDNIVRGATIVWNTVSGIFKTVLKAISDTVVAQWNFMYGIISGVLQNISNFVVRIWNSVYAFMAGVLKSISNTIVAEWNSIYAFFAGILQAISNFFVQRWNNLVSNTTYYFNLVKQVIVNIWNSIVGAVQGPINQIINNVKNFGQSVINVFAGAGGWLVSAGSNVVRGLWNGIAGMAGWLYNNVMSFIRNNVPGPVLKLLGIHSPSTLFAEYGKYTMQGFGQGVTNQASAVQTTMTKTMQGIAQSGKQALSAGLVGTGMNATVSSSMLGGVNGGTASTTNNKNQSFAPNIVINVSGSGSASDMGYAANKAVLDMQNRALFS